MGKKLITDYKVTLRPDIQYRVYEDTGFLGLCAPKKDSYLSIGFPGSNWHSYTVSYMGNYDEQKDLEICCFFWFLGIFSFNSSLGLAKMKELDKSRKLKHILKSFDGLRYKHDDTKYRRDHYIYYFVKNRQTTKPITFSAIEAINFKFINGEIKETGWKWRSSNPVEDDFDLQDTELSYDEMIFIKECIRFSYLQNIKWVSNYDYTDYFVLSYNEDCVERAEKLGWIK